MAARLGDGVPSTSLPLCRTSAVDWFLKVGLTTGELTLVIFLKSSDE